MLIEIWILENIANTQMEFPQYGFLHVILIDSLDETAFHKHCTRMEYFYQITGNYIKDLPENPYHHESSDAF